MDGKFKLHKPLIPEKMGAAEKSQKMGCAGILIRLRLY
jgi:hypothetical protein